MAQREHLDPTNRTTWNNQNTHFTNLAILGARMNAGQIIFKSDMLLLNTLIRNYLGHYHTYEDLVQEATFGNNGDRNRYAENRNSNIPSHGINTPINLENAESFINSTSGRIVAQVTNILAKQVRSLRTHTHVIFDKIAR